MAHFQELGFSRILFALSDSPHFEFRRRCLKFSDGSRMISAGVWKPDHKVDRALWRKMGLEVLLYKKNDIYVASAGLESDFESCKVLLELTGRPSNFLYGRHSSMSFRYDKLCGEGKVEETYVHVDKIGGSPWLLDKPERLDELKKYVQNYGLEGAFSRR